MSTQDTQLNTILNWILSTPDTDVQDCDSTEWFDELYDWAYRVANGTGCPPQTSHVFGCDKCYHWFENLIRRFEWDNTEEGARYSSESKHWSWHNLIKRGLPLQPRTDILHAGDRDWMVVGRQSPPKSMPLQ